MKINLFKRDVLFIALHVSVFWNFCNGYIQLCQDSNIGSHNGTTVTAEIGKPASVLFCVTSDRTVYIDAFFYHPSHRRGWIRIKEKPEKVVSKFNITNTINLTIDKVQRNDLNVSFSVNVYAELNNGDVDYRDFIILSFILHEQTRLNIITDKTQTDDISTKTITPTSACQPQTTLRCPENWFSGKDMCLKVIPREHLCSVYGAELPEETLATYLTSCLTYLLENTSSTVILLKSSKYFDVKTKSTTHEPENYQEVCIKGQTLPAQESPAHNPPDKDSKIRDIGLTAGIVLVATALIGFLIYSYRMKLLRRSRQLVTEKKAEGRSGHNEIALLPLARDQTDHISGSGYEDISREKPTCPVDLNSPYSHYEEIRNVETGSRERSSAPTKRESSDIQRDQVEYEIPVTEKPKDDNPTPYVQHDDHQPGAQATPISSASKEISQFSNVVEYENTLPAL